MIKRENWKGKYWVIDRVRGRIINKKKWGSKFTLIDAKRQYKQTKSFDKNIIKTQLYAVRETTDYRKGARRPTGKSQYVITASTKDGKTISARSYSKFSEESSKKEIIEEARERFFSNYAEASGVGYDKELGEEEFNEDKENNKILDYKEGWVSYADSKKF